MACNTRDSKSVGRNELRSEVTALAKDAGRPASLPKGSSCGPLQKNRFARNHLVEKNRASGLEVVKVDTAFYYKYYRGDYLGVR